MSLSDPASLGLRRRLSRRGADEAPRPNNPPFEWAPPPATAQRAPASARLIDLERRARFARGVGVSPKGG